MTAVGSGDAGITASDGGLSVDIQVEVNIPSSDRDTLIALYNALGGPNWMRSLNWLSDLPLDAWHGVETDDDGRVTKLYPGFDILSSGIPSELGKLSELTYLALWFNEDLSGPLPVVIFSLAACVSDAKFGLTPRASRKTRSRRTEISSPGTHAEISSAQK